MNRTHRASVGSLVAAVAAAAAVAATAAPVAGARSQTLSLYQVEGPTQFYNAAGKKLHINPPAELPVAGDYFEETDLDYVGTSKSHAKQWSASDHLSCTITGPDTGLCDAQFAIGGSLLIFNRFTLQLSANSAVVPLSEGTGSFAHAHGTLSITDLPDGNADVVARVS